MAGVEEVPLGNRPTSRLIADDVESVNVITLFSEDPKICDEIRAQARYLNAQAQAAVFVGAIQAQGLAISIINNATSLQVTTNNMFLIGILLNVVGAYYALTTASSLEVNLNRLDSFFQGKTNEQLGEIAGKSLPDLTRRIVDNYCFHCGVKPEHHGSQSLSNRKSPLPDTTLRNISLSITRDKKAGFLSVVVIFLGFATCLGAFLCLTQATKHMSIPAMVVVGLLLFLRAVVYII